MFAASLSLATNPVEARLVADNLEALARALREWPDEAWTESPESGDLDESNQSGAGLFDRLVKKVRPLARDRRQKQQAIASAEETAQVLRALWPEAGRVPAGGVQHAAMAPLPALV